MPDTKPSKPSKGSRARGVRERARAELTAEILATARRHLATQGAAGLSLRAVARDLGMASSAVYRYVPSREDLLTRLIVEAFDSMGEAAEAAAAARDPDDPEGRFTAVCLAVRRWALANEHSYALIFGSPVPGYQAPPDTVPPATRVPALLTGILVAAVRQGRPGTAYAADPLPPPLRDALAPVRGMFPPEVSDELVVRGLMAWTYLFGAVSFDLFGHRHDVIADERAADNPFFAEEVRRLCAFLGLSVTHDGS